MLGRGCFTECVVWFIGRYDSEKGYGVIMVEAMLDSGTMHTVNYAKRCFGRKDKVMV